MIQNLKQKRTWISYQKKKKKKKRKERELEYIISQKKKKKKKFTIAFYEVSYFEIIV